MYLHLLEIVYGVEDRKAVEGWLSQTHLGGVVISTEQYDDQILAVLASEQALEEASQHLQRYPAVSSCEEKWRFVYRIAITSASEHILSSFPFSPGEEWYIGPEKTMYLSVQTQQLGEKQLAWLARSPDIARWEYLFDLTSVLAAGAFLHKKSYPRV